MLFASQRQKEEMGSGNLHLLAIAILREIEMWVYERTGETLLVTSIHRTPAENDALYGGRGDHLVGPHVLWRAVDFRSREIPALDVARLLDYTNTRWVYDLKQPKLDCLIHEVARDLGSTGEHLHLSVRPGATMLRTPSLGEEA